MKLIQRIAFIAFMLAGLMALVLAGLAGADVKVKATGTGATYSMKFVIEGVPNPGACQQITNDPLPDGASIGRYCVGLTDPASNRAVAQARNVGGDLSSSVWAFGDASAGENQIETLPDSLASAVGLYQAPGGTALGSNPDSLLRVHVVRSPGLVTLSIPNIVVNGQTVGSGGMQVRAFNPKETSIAEFRLAVYQNQAAADADINSDGFGAVFFGRAVLETGVGVPTGLSTYGNFTGTDFMVQPQGSGKFTLRPAANRSWAVPVTNSDAAVVALIGDPRSTARSVPATSPLGLGILTLVLMASGVWVLNSRRKASVA